MNKYAWRMITVLVLLSIILAACGDMNPNERIFGFSTEREAEQPQTADGSAGAIDQDGGTGAANQESSLTPSSNGEEGQTEYLTCLTENPHTVAQDITERFQISYQEVENWYCRGYSFEDIMLALMTTKLWGIDTDDVLQAHETQTWDQIWVELDESQQ